MFVAPRGQKLGHFENQQIHFDWRISYRVDITRLAMYFAGVGNLPDVPASTQRM
jgi:hypothetical protein